ncbi:MAG: hypothetical protein JW847_06970 [Candidatus Omnitrophica bacterium]|nr:hypothetical protein [Candidatus Omnitrophota bacterium]
MRPINHVLISAGVTAIFSVWVRSWTAIGACFLSGIFIDLDHHLDYYLAKKKIPFNYKKLDHFCKKEREAKIYLFLHSYEFLALLWVTIFLFKLNVIWIGIAVGCTTHVLCDEVANPLRPLSYFFTYRFLIGFKREYFFKKGYRDE